MNKAAFKMGGYAFLLIAVAGLAGGAWMQYAASAQTPFPRTHLLWGAIALTLCIPLLLGKLYALYRRHTRQVLFLLDAIENNDYTIHFPENVPHSDINLVNQALNRIVYLLYNIKNETVQQEKYYELILECIHTGIIVLDDNGAVYQKNKAALHLLGLDVFTHVNQLNRIDAQLTAHLTNSRRGDTFQVPLHNERGSLNLLVNVSDITVRRQHLRIFTLNDINNELDEKEIDSWIRLTRVLTHEIMNNVTPITSLSDTLLQLTAQGAPQEEISSGLKTISQTGKSLLTFIESYRQFTHIPTPVPSLFYVKDFLNRMAELAQHQYPDSHTTMHTEVKPDNLILYADESLISLVMTNLLKNAIQAIESQSGTSPQGHISLKAYCDETEAVIIEVSNNGPAIPPDIAQHIFIPFFTTKEKGSGIGLSISRQIMRLSGGSITLLAGTPTTFVLRFN